MKNKITVFGSKGIIFFCAIALAVVGLALTGCPTDEDDPGGGGAEFPAAWVADSTWQDWRVGGIYQGASVYFSGDSMNSGVIFYNLKSFTGDGAGSGTFTVKQVANNGRDEIDGELTVTYTYNSAASTLTLASTDIEFIGGVYSKYTP